MAYQGYTVKLKTVVEELGLETVYTSGNYDIVEIYNADVNRPGLQLAGHYDEFDPRRVQIIGLTETNFMRRYSPERRRRLFGTLMSHRIPAFVVCHDLEPYPECVEMAERYDITLLKTHLDTSEFMAQLIGVLRTHLAPRQTMHGGLVEVHGEGLLILGDSGIGKSEVALELVKRGHRLIADDAVIVKRMSRTTLLGQSPEIIQYYMEVRGIGVIDVRNIYGMGAVKPTENIDLIVHLEIWDEDKEYDRLGLETMEETILGVKVPAVNVPVRPGRNIAVILEVAAMNNRQKKMGYNAAEALVERYDSNIDNQWTSFGLGKY